MPMLPDLSKKGGVEADMVSIYVEPDALFPQGQYSTSTSQCLARNCATSHQIPASLGQLSEEGLPPIELLTCLVHVESTRDRREGGQAEAARL